MSESDHFARVAAAEGWSLATQVGVLLTYIDNQASPEAFEDYLAEQRFDDPSGDSDRDFLWAVAQALQHPRLALAAEFQEFCGNASDQLTVEQAVEAWRRTEA